MIKSIPVIALGTLLITGAASAANIADIQTPVDTSSVILNVDDDNIATLTGTVERVSDKLYLEQAILDLDEVEEVRNLLAH